MQPRRGFALIAALWLMVALAALGFALAESAFTWRRTALAAIDVRSARAAAASGIAQGAAQLRTLLRNRRGGAPRDVQGVLSDPWRDFPAAVAESVQFATARVRLRLRDAGTTLNLNSATDAELRRLFASLRMDAGLADRIAQRIADWRDPDDLRRGRGAERANYVDSGRVRLPANQAFRETEELLDVMGVTPEIYARIAPYLSAVGSGVVNLSRAERPVLLALPGMTEEAVASVVRARRTPGASLDLNRIINTLSPSARDIMLPQLPVLLSRTSAQTREIEIWSDGQSLGGPPRVRAHAVIVRAGDDIIIVRRHFEWSPQ